MATKEFCKTLDKCADNEPIFVLRAQDTLAPMVVEYWAELAAKMQVPTSKVLEAFDCANAMRRWENRRIPD